MRIGFLIGKVVENHDRKEELDILKVEYKIVYSWRILKKYEDLGYSIHHGRTPKRHIRNDGIDI